MLGAIVGPGPLFLPGIILLVAGIALYTAARYWPAKPTAVAGVRVEGGAAPAGATDVEYTGPVTANERAMPWPLLIEPDAGALSVDDRRIIIEGLAVVGDPWCANVLARAYDEESETLRESVIDAIGRCRGEVGPTLERALRSHRVAERYAAVDAASRRGAIPLLERGIRDADGTVALAAAYGLARAGRRDLIDKALAGRDDVRANDIRRILPVLA